MMDKNENLPFDALIKGYILIPKALLTESLNQKESELSYLEAFLMILAKVNYMDNSLTIRGCKINCSRGESLMSFKKWGELFHWKRHKARRFFTKMEKYNLIQVTPTDISGIIRIKVIDYDMWTNKPTDDWEKRKTKTDESFDEFWNTYHEVTQTPKREVGPARREWSKLTLRERRLALEQINYYYHSLENTKYIKRGFTYLRDKSFLNE